MIGMFWGERPSRRRLRILRFACPQCRSDRQGIEYLVTMRSHVMGLPMGRVAGSEHTVVWCGTCRRQFPASQADAPSYADRQRATSTAVPGAIALVARQAGDGPAVRAASSTAAAAYGLVLDDGAALADRATLDEQLRLIGQAMNVVERQGLVGHLLRVAGANGVELRSEQYDLIAELGSSIGLDELQLRLQLGRPRHE